MLVSQILRTKGDSVFTTGPDERLAAAAELLHARYVGALVVMDAERVVGILSERDIVRAVATQGADALDLAVEELMTKEVKTCRPTDTVKDLMQMMTLRRHRHVPVCDDAGELVGVMSIGDAVKARLDEQAHEVAVLKDIALVR